MRPRVQAPHLPQLPGTQRKTGLLEHIAPGTARHSVGHEAAKQVGNRLRVSDCPEETLHPNSSKAGKEILQVHTQHDALPYVRRSKSLNRAPLHKAMHRGVRRNAVKDGGQNPPLQIFQTRLRDLNQPNAAGSFGQHAVVIVFEARLWALVAERLEVSKPTELRGINLKPVRQSSYGFDRGIGQFSAAATGRINGGPAIR